MASLSGGEAPVIRIVRKKKGDGGHHGGAWKVAYADFVTAMMAFFLVMWIIGLNKPLRQAVAAYFKNPTMFENGGKKIISADDKAAVSPPVPKPPMDMSQLEKLFKSKAEAILR